VKNGDTKVINKISNILNYRINKLLFIILLFCIPIIPIIIIGQHSQISDTSVYE
jgi:hypothetical protein